VVKLQLLQNTESGIGSILLPNGTSTTYSYDPASQVTHILHQLTATSAQINQAAYAYNPVGNRTSLTDRRGPQSFGYDPLDRLTSASHPLLATPQAFAYDPVGNRTTGGSVVNAGNQLTADATHAYQYDDNGNLTRKTLLATGNFTQYTYDAENFAAGNPTPAFTSTYRYDGLGRRIEKVANGQTRRYIYDGEDILLEYDGANVLQARYTHGPGIDEPIAVTRGGNTFFYHQDGLGTVTDLTDSAGATAKSYAYDAYGNLVDQTGTVDQPYTYTGREFDAETGLYHYRARYYDSQIGRFLQKDPMGFVGPEMNAYSYVTNNPTNFADPMGLKRRKWQGVTAYVPSDPYQYPNQMIGGDELGATVCKANAVWYWIRQDILDDKEDGRCGITECLIRHETQHVDDVISINKSVCQGAPDNAKVFVDPSVGLEREGHKVEKDCLVENLKNPSCGCEIRLTQRLVKVQANLSGRLK
jgi:RHS repeat-associated protein